MATSSCETLTRLGKRERNILDLGKYRAIWDLRISTSLTTTCMILARLVREEEVSILTFRELLFADDIGHYLHDLGKVGEGGGGGGAGVGLLALALFKLGFIFGNIQVQKTQSRAIC